MATRPGEAGRGPGTGAPGELLPRLGARLIDSLVVGLVGVLIGVALDFSLLWVVIQAGLVFAYFVVLDVAWGTTAGKALLGLRVSGPGGALPTPGEAIAREAFTLLGAVPFAGPVLALVAWIAIGATINSSPTKQGVHDSFAGGTRVTRT